MDPDLFRGMGAVVFVLALLASALWALRRVGGPGIGKLSLGKFGVVRARAVGSSARGPLIQVLSRTPLTPQHSLHLVSAGGRELLLATHAGGCTLLADFAEAGNPEPTGSEAHGKILSQTHAAGGAGSRSKGAAA